MLHPKRKVCYVTEVCADLHRVGATEHGIASGIEIATTALERRVNQIIVEEQEAGWLCVAVETTTSLSDYRALLCAMLLFERPITPQDVLAHQRKQALPGDAAAPSAE